MMSLNSLLMKVRDELNSIEIETEEGTVKGQFYHYRRPANVKAEYGIWSETGEVDSFNANNRKAEQQVTGYLDYYTLIEYNPMIDMIQDTLEELHSGGWSLNSVQYEDQTNLIHYEWYFTVV